MPAKSLHELITPAALRKLAGAASFTRGEEYVAAGAVRQLDRRDDTVTATVHGGTEYDVCIWVGGDALHFECGCPFATLQHAYCKHFVAVGLAAIGAPAHAPPLPAKPVKAKRRNDDWSELDTFLRGLDAGTLADWLIDAARHDRRLHAELRRRSAPVAFDEAALRQLIDEATDLPGWVPWFETGPPARAIERVVGKLEQLRTPATAPALTGLLEYLLARVERAMENVDDSTGEMGDALLHVGQAHLETCTLAQPDPAALAERLFTLAVESTFGIWDFSPDNYAVPLGAVGRERYREVALAAWRALSPAQAAGAERGDTIARIVQDLAGDDIDLKVEVIARDLSSAYRYRLVARVLHDAGRVGDAVEWARRGLAKYGAARDCELCDIVADDHLAQGRPGQAFELRLSQLEYAPSLRGYRQAADCAARGGQWPAWRERAWAALARHRQRMLSPSRTTEVEIALWENDIDRAWQHALAGECDAEQLLALARALEPLWPDDAFACYRRLVRLTLERHADDTRPVYAVAIEYVRRIVALLAGVDRAAEAAQYLAFLRTEYQRKRNFMKLLDGLEQG